MRTAVLERDGHRCTHVDEVSGQRCPATEDLRCCHIKPFRDFAPDDPAAYDPTNGVTRCGDHDVATDSYARRRRRPKKSSPSAPLSMPRIR